MKWIFKSGIALPLACFLLALAILLLDCLAPLGIAGGVPYVAVVLLSVQVPKPMVTVYAGVVCSLFTIFGVLISPAGDSQSAVLTNRLLALFAIWVTAGLGLRWKLLLDHYERAQSEREKALRDVKILRGLLPICASCKKIRDEAGRWDQLEVYVRKHSEANFTHGICPGCALELYGVDSAAEKSGPVRRFRGKAHRPAGSSTR